VDLADYLQLALGQLVAASPALLLWIAVTIFGAVRLERGGGRPERFLILGGAAGILAALLRALTGFSVLLAHGGDFDAVYTFENAISLLGKVVSAAAILLLVYAFWLKFKQRKIEAIIELERSPHDVVPE
jgi:hypothetical protein